MPQYQNESLAIENLQRYLRQLSYHVPSITAPPIDGVFASDTQKALREFQEWQALPSTGIADRETWDALYAAYRASLAESTPARAVSFFPFTNEAASLSPENRNFATSVLQHMLRELSALYTSLETVAMTGIYDAATEQAVRDFQQKNRLPITGITDLATWNAVADQYNVLFSVEPFM